MRTERQSHPNLTCNLHQAGYNNTLGHRGCPLAEDVVSSLTSSSIIFKYLDIVVCTSETMASQKRYGKLPPSANSEAIEPFTFNIPDAELTRLNTLLQLSTIAAENYENTYADKANQFGLTREWLVAAKDRWENGFDWYVGTFTRLHLYKSQHAEHRPHTSNHINN